METKFGKVFVLERETETGGTETVKPRLLESIRFSNTDYKFYDSEGKLSPLYKNYEGRPLTIQYNIKQQDKDGKQVEFQAKLNHPYKLGELGQQDFESVPTIDKEFREQWERRNILSGDENADDTYRVVRDIQSANFIASLCPGWKISQMKLLITSSDPYLLFDDYADKSVSQKNMPFKLSQSYYTELDDILKGEAVSADLKKLPASYFKLMRGVEALREVISEKSSQPTEYLLQSFKQFHNACLLQSSREWNDKENDETSLMYKPTSEEIRLITVAGRVTVEIILFDQGIQLNEKIRESFLFENIMRLHGKSCALVNDLVSLKKEMADGETANSAYIFHVKDGLPLEEALQKVVDEINLVTKIIHETGELLISLYGEYEETKKLVDIVKTTIAGNMQWSAVAGMSSYLELPKYSEFDQVNSVHNFVKKLISKYFSNCSLLVLQDKYDSGRNVSTLISTLTQNVYLIKFNRTEAEESNSETGKYSRHFFKQISNTHKRSSFCTVAILFVNDVNPTLMHKIQQIIAPTFLPIVRKDEDHFIFITSPEYHKKLLLMNELPSRVKFKIAIGRLENGDNAITTVNFFGGKMATPLVTQFSSVNVPEDFDYFPDFLWNLKGKILKVSIPYTYSKVEAHLPWGTVGNGKRGNSKYILEEFLMVKFNFTYTMIVSTGMDGNYGAGGTGLQLPNGTWIGITGDLLYGRADLGLAIVNTDKRIKYIGFTDTYFDTGCLTFVTGQPSQIFSAFTLLWPFNIFVWISMFFSVIFGIVFFSIVFKLAVNNYVHLEDSFSITRQIPILLSPFIEQDSEMPVSTSLRCFFAFWLFFTMIINTLYRSKLVALLAFPVLVDIPETFDQLAYSDFKVAFMKHGDSALNTFKASRDPVYVKLYKEMEVVRGMGLECLEKVVREENSACIAYDFDVMYLRGRNFSNADSRKIMSSTARTYNIWIGVATEANSIYRINFGKIVGNTMPFHMVNIWDQMDMYSNVKLLKLKWWAETNQTWNANGEEEQDSQNLTLKHIKGSFYMWLCCLTMSFMALCYEFIAFRCGWKLLILASKS
ncbi:unnamed protein product [Orchesella dallaii]|uniref:Ionotropic glutamate receptor C-terminal domain-containing protein n=1 Tax=Orchesella dallaii TaxID=48710 RepID=A0ABP1QY21_9HEXA